MENRLAEVVAKTVITEVDAELSLCSCESDVVDETCSLGGDDTCGDGCTFVPTNGIGKYIVLTCCEKEKNHAFGW